MRLASTRSIVSLAFTSIMAAWSTSSYAVFIDGTGSYSLRGQTRSKPGFTNAAGTYEGIEQFFRLETEVRTSDKASFFAEFRLFDGLRENHFGDSGEVVNCSRPIDEENSNFSSSEDCNSLPNEVLEPHYQAYLPRISKAYVQYASSLCLLSVGRRGRSWGLGMILDDGSGPFATDESVFDGVTCDVNLQESETLGFSIGYDKITETGASVFLQGGEKNFGVSEKSDDVDQLFFTINYDDQGASSGSPFSQKIGIYFANIFSGSNMETDIKLADLYLDFILGSFNFKQEVLFRLGKSADPSLARLGGVRSAAASAEDEGASRLTNDVQSIAVAGNLEYFLTKAGSKEAKQAHSQSLFFEYAYAPGDADGYYPVYPAGDLTVNSRRDQKASAVAFHRNFKPALILFNAPKSVDNLRVDGVFDPYRLMNVTVLGAGYRYKDSGLGDFEFKLISASLNETPNQEIIDSFKDEQQRPIGYAGKDLGLEFDFSYKRQLDLGLEFGGDLAIALPGEAWDIYTDRGTENNFLIQAHMSFSF